MLLVLRAQAGDEKAFAALYDLFATRTLAYLAALIGEGAEDAHQELWIGVYRSISSVHNPSAFRTWLFRATRHRAVDYLRSRRRERELFTTDEDAWEIAGPSDDARPDAEAIDLAIRSLPPPQREVLLLRYRDDMSYADIALIVGIPIGTVRTRLHHARRRLHDLLHEDI
jgi:RNA polymerase sigma-70 factor (ECF subfamily)